MQQLPHCCNQAGHQRDAEHAKQPASYSNVPFPPSRSCYLQNNPRTYCLYNFTDLHVCTVTPHKKIVTDNVTRLRQGRAWSPCNFWIIGGRWMQAKTIKGQLSIQLKQACMYTNDMSKMCLSLHDGSECTLMSFSDRYAKNVIVKRQLSAALLNATIWETRRGDAGWLTGSS